MSRIFERFSDYDFRHWVAVQAEDGDAASIHRLFAHRSRNLGNSWFEARNRRNEISGYMADLDIARSLADSAAASRTSGRREGIALQCRYTLIAAVIRDLASKHLPALAERYVRAGVWTQDQALAWARLNPDQQAGLQSVTDALRQAEAKHKDELGRLALLTGAGIGDSDNRVLSIADMAE